MVFAKCGGVGNQKLGFLASEAFNNWKKAKKVILLIIFILTLKSYTYLYLFKNIIHHFLFTVNRFLTNISC